MGPTSLMRHRASVWRSGITQDGTSQVQSGYNQIAASVPCFIQPASSNLQYWYMQRGTTVTHNVYTTAVNQCFKREDILLGPDGNQYHLVADPLNALQSNIYLELHCEQYPENARQRLNIEQVNDNG